MPLLTANRVPVATYRLQLRREYPFPAATAIVPHLAALGISDLYCSPILLSTPGSSHGYDVNDYRRIDPKLGGRAALEQLHAELSGRGMGLLLDFVPNHMGINGPGLLNAWWRDVLENGEHSLHAQFFDIDWNPGLAADEARVLVPILGDHYGRVLESGGLALIYEAGTLCVAYGEMRFPVRPQTYARVLTATAARGDAAETFAQLGAGFRGLSRAIAGENLEHVRARGASFSALKRELAALTDRLPAAGQALEARLQAINGRSEEPASYDELDALIEQQHYRLAYWRAGVHETNYRRFFAIDTLIGLRVEIPEVFQECHALLARLLREQIVTGVRIDHIDGLRDPAQYLERLQGLVADEGPVRSAPLYVVVEKITAEGESLPASWATHGTTGYEFMAQVAGVLVDARTERAFTRTYLEFSGERASFDDVVYEKKRLVLDEMFANAVTQLAQRLVELLRADRRWRDVTRHELTVAVREIMAAHGVYRTYRQSGHKMDEPDRRVVEQACAIAINRNRRVAAEPFELVRAVLTGDYAGHGNDPIAARRLSEWVLSFQQYTGAIMAKAVEDTAFYTYSRFLALNEVGGNPGLFGGNLASFHAANEERLRRTPHAMNATATHDTKMGEDLRARLYALSELPQAWREWVGEWSELNRGHKTSVDGRSAPDTNEEYRLYQLLLGAWPADDADPDETFRGRIREHLRKAVNEAKRNTSWIQPNEPWLEAGDRFVNAVLSPETAREFLVSLRERAQWLARLGMVNSLTQVVLKITTPGVPDFYQGTELWDLSLVDPDNRREVDYAIRDAMTRSTSSPDWVGWLRDWRTGEIKLRVTQTLLQFRQQHVELFQRGDYRPLETKGRFADRCLAFIRAHKTKRLIVVVPRLTSRLGCPPLGLVWDDTEISFSDDSPWRDIVTGTVYPGSGDFRLERLFSHLPFAVLVQSGED